MGCTIVIALIITLSLDTKAKQNEQNKLGNWEKEVTIKLADRNIVGTISAPDSEQFSLVILLPGVGSHDRDYVLFGKPFFKDMADYLHQNGIASFRFDRPAGETDHLKMTIREQAENVEQIACILLEEFPKISQIGILGHSQGGMIATIVASHSPKVTFIILVGTPAVKGVDYNLDYERSMAEIQGLSDDQIAGIQKFQREVFDVVLQNESKKSIEILQEMYTELKPRRSQQRINATIHRITSDWFKFNLKYKPDQYFMKIKCPVLAIYGEYDRQIPPSQNIAALRTILTKNENLTVEIVTLLSHNHLFQISETGNPYEYEKIESTFSQQFLNTVSDWIRRLKNLQERT